VPRQDTNFSLIINDTEGPEYGNLVLQETNLGKVMDLSAQCDSTSTGGSLLGLEKTRQEILNYKDTLNEIAVTLKDKILGKNTSPPPASTVDFFLGSLVDGDFDVNGAIISDPSIIEGTRPP